MVLIVGVNFKLPKHACSFLASRIPLHKGLSTKECMSILSLSDPVFTLWETAFFSGGKEMQHFGW
jgi:hypothetical protein